METKNLFKAIAAFQQEVPVIHQGSSGYGYTYASLGQIFKVIKPLLLKHGIGFTQLMNGDALVTVIFHIESGELIESSVNIRQDVTLAKMNAYQVLGSAITYYRRYSLAAALGLITDKDTDAAGEQDHATVTATVEPAPANGSQNASKNKVPLTREHSSYIAVVKHLEDGGPMADVEKRFTLTKEVKIQLLKDANLTTA